MDLPSVPFQIHPHISLGAAGLSVSDLLRTIDFYQQSLGMRVRYRDSSWAVLGNGIRDMLILKEKPGARTAPRRLELYHIGIVLPSRRLLASALQNFIETRAPITGFADHYVSEAVYITDPDGHSIEVSWDRPREKWLDFKGQILMRADALNVGDLMAELDLTPVRWEGLPQDARVGHIHLHTQNLEAAEQFYTQVLGFTCTSCLSGICFLGAGGYHHHIGVSTWLGTGMVPGMEDALGIIGFEIFFPDSSALQQLLHHLELISWYVKEQGQGWLIYDPSHNPIMLRAV